MNELITAAFEGNVEEVKNILTSKEEWVDHQDKNDLTPLMWAVRKGHVEVVKVLLENGANPLATDNRDLNALIYAKIFCPTAKYEEILRLLQNYNLVSQPIVVSFAILKFLTESLPIQGLFFHCTRQHCKLLQLFHG